MQATSEKLEYLKTEIQKAIISTDISRKYYRAQAFRGSISTSILAAMSTVFLGLKINTNVDTWTQRIALFISALITVISAYNTFYNHKDLWVSNNDVQNKFRKLLFDINYICTGVSTISDDQVNEWKTDYQKIRDEQNNKWLGYRSSKS